MIVNSTQQGWDVIIQRSHGMLAGQIAFALLDLRDAKYLLETWQAIISHDDYKEDLSGTRYITAAGAPKDFTMFEMTDEERFQEAKRRIENQTLRHRWIGLLQSRHVEALYANQNIDINLKQLIKDEKKRRGRVLKELKLTSEELEQSYEFLGWADRCSLILCRNQIPAMGRHLEIVTTNSGTRYEIRARDDQSLEVSPWPFLKDHFEVGLDVHQLTTLQFANDAELLQALLESPTEYRTWTFQKSG